MTRKCEDCLYTNRNGCEEPCAECLKDVSVRANWTPKNGIPIQEPFAVAPPLMPTEVNNALMESAFAPKPSALDTQVGGGHYKDLAIQPMMYSFKNKLDPCQHTAIKYITRFRDKDGKKDLIKAKHCIDLLIQLEYGEE